MKHIDRRAGSARPWKLSLWLLMGISLAITRLPLCARPSGGPYGPVAQIYTIPDNAGKIYFAAPDGLTDAAGRSIESPTTLEAAIERAVSGDAIILRGGIYRTGNLILNQGITIQPYQNEEPVLKGTFVAGEWTDLGDGLWVTSWEHLFPAKPADWWRRHREARHTPLHRFNNDMVFSDGRFLQSAGWPGDVNEDTYFIDYENKEVYIGTDPDQHLIEITAFDVGILRTTEACHGKISDRKGPVIRGITLTQYAYRALEIMGTDPEGLSDESRHGKEVTGTILENCTISHCSRVAAYLRGDHLTISHCRISDTSTEGIYILSSSDVLLEKNIFTRNNIEQITGYYPAAVKIFNQCYRVTCKDNLVTDLPWSNGIWYDVGNVDGVFIDNWVEDVGDPNSYFSADRPWPSQNGFFFEISKGAICAGNVFVNCDHGLWALNSSDVQIYQNTFINSTVCFGRDGRSAAGDHFGWHPSTGPDVDKREGHVLMNNLLVGETGFNRPLLYVWQPSSLCDQLFNPQLETLDYNVFVRTFSAESIPLILWSPAGNENCQLKLDSPEELHRKYPYFSAHSWYFKDFHGQLFKSRELENLQILSSFPGSGTGNELPQAVRKLIGETEKNNYPGAYKPIE